jgi:carbamoyltransferase
MSARRVVLGLGQTHNASACLLVDGELIACASEERFNRVKNTTAFPSHAVRYVLAEAGLSPGDVDHVMHSYRHPIPNYAIESEAVAESLVSVMAGARRAANHIVAVVPQAERLLRGTYTGLAGMMRSPYESSFKSTVGRQVGVSPERVEALDHHYCHAAAGYAFYLDGERWERPALILTLDAEGDEKCATVSVARRGRIEVKAVTGAGNSIGVLYGAVTEWLGMRMNEHEYKVMGLAPYAPAFMVEEVERLLAPLITVDGLVFRSRYSSGAFPHLLDRILRRRRFDAVAGAVQLLLERRVIEWARNAIREFGIGDLVLSGGVFMNVKANKAIMEMPEVTSLTVCPSAADESTPLGAAIACHLDAAAGPVAPHPLRHLYLGPEFSERQVEEALRDADAFARYEVTPLAPDAEVGAIAEMLTNGEIVARFAGRMEFGARALGNRSILAHPSRRELVRTINEQIKGRDFWMPFGCSIMAEAADDYLVNPKQVAAPFMALAFDTRPQVRESIAAGTHAYDHTVRPHVVQRDANPRYHAIIDAFRRRTGVAAVLNTSFNLHGEPLVCTPGEALDVFARSGLRVLQLDRWVVRKRDSLRPDAH